MITFQYFDGCPHAETTFSNLLRVSRELGIPESSIERVRVPDAAHAKACGFQGSPTILVHGRDIVTGETPTGFHYTCRVYAFDGKPTGAIPMEWMRARLVEWGEAGTAQDPGRGDAAVVAREKVDSGG